MEGLVTADEIKDGLLPARRAIACILDTLCSARESITSLENTHAVWVALSEPGISLCDYALRLLTYMHCSPSCLIVSIIYIDRLIQLNGNISIHSLTIHRLLLAAMVVAAKYWDDEFYKNSYYARVGGLPIGELNKLEADFCFELNFELHIDPELFAHYFHELVKHPTSSRCPRCNPPATMTATDTTRPGPDSSSDVQEDEPMEEQPKHKRPSRPQGTLSPSVPPRIHIPPMPRFSGSMQTRHSREELEEADSAALKRHTASFNRHSSSNGFRNLATQELLAAAHAYSAASAYSAIEQKTAPTNKEW